MSIMTVCRIVVPPESCDDMIAFLKGIGSFSVPRRGIEESDLSLITSIVCESDNPEEHFQAIGQYLKFMNTNKNSMSGNISKIVFDVGIWPSSYSGNVMAKSFYLDKNLISLAKDALAEIEVTAYRS